MRTVYLGTSDFAVAVLDRLLGSAHAPSLVITRPDRPKGRGRRLSPPPVAVRAAEAGVDLLQPGDLHAPDVLERIAAAAPDALVVCAYGALVRAPLLDAYEVLNVHPSLLPRWRGAAPVERAIMAGDTETGVAIMRLTAGLDEGPVCLMEREPIAPEDDYGALAARLQDLGADLLVRALDERPPFEEQGEEGITYAEKITAEDRRLDPSRPAQANHDAARALSPHIGARIALPDGGPLGVWRTEVGGEARPGEVVSDGDALVLGCADAGLTLAEVQPPGGRRMPAADFLRGRADLASGWRPPPA